MTAEGCTPRRLCHRGLLYRGVPEYLDALAAFVEEGLQAGEPVMVAVPGSKGNAIHDRVKHEGTYFVDMAELGRNPGRIIPAVEEFLEHHYDQPSRFVGEPIWVGRSAGEIAEATRHEALINVAFADRPMTILCPYDGEALPTGVLDGLWRTHPEVHDAGLSKRSREYGDPSSVYADEDWPLSDRPAGVEVRPFQSDNDLSNLRVLVQQFGWRAGLSVDRVDDFVLAVSEVAGNSVRHGGGRGDLSLWRNDEGAVICEIRDAGHITDPLAGRHAPGPDLDVTGLWLVNQLCDLVEIRSGPVGTRVRLTLVS
jgi:anti-sigma regulatory factor (Ser/Thr protein kinase)